MHAASGTQKPVACVHNLSSACKGRVLLWDLQQNGRNWVGNQIVGQFRSYDTFAGQVGPLAFAESAAIDTEAVDLALMAMPCSDGTVQVAAMETFEQLFSLSVTDCMHSASGSQSVQVMHTVHKVLAAFSPCGQWLATTHCSHGAKLQIWQTETGQLEANITNGLAMIRVLKWVRQRSQGPEMTGKGFGVLLVTGDAVGACKLYSFPDNTAEDDCFK